ncbi:hypothetical protein [Heyndrickxia vini]|uniref:Multi-TM2 domain-containing protein n=1 Tax=Heyndrickxia vini TaxID=1476025 RepID=A0ABX7E0F1_9BACI|nr:hypothetical protein [Heyndrickxia vini]QQZ09081.1 hypothetical protein I5776_19190 [Heyndrickxia vini]
MNKKNPIIAFLLAFFPGGGLMYLRKGRGIFYTIVTFGLALMAMYLIEIMFVGMFILAAIFLALAIYIVNFIDTGITASKLYQHGTNEQTVSTSVNPDTERFYSIILSFVPGLGHFQLGLMNRGLTILVSFLGFGVMVIFITFLSGRGEFLVFLIFLLVIWIYGFFDVMQQLTKKQCGEELIDQSILEELEMKREEGKKSRSIATFLSIFPGVGHLYLGLQIRGIQLMAAFLFSIYILDVMRLGVFLFLVPIIWFYSFFDGLQKASKFGKEEMNDQPVISYLINHQKWVGIGLLVLGLYYLFVNILLPTLSPIIYRYINIDLQVWFNRYFQTALVSVLLIGGGVKLIVRNKRKGVGEQ